MQLHYLHLGLAIIFEIIATSALKASQGFTQWLPSVIAVLGYIAAFYFLALALRGIALGVAYAIWSGVGIVLLAVIGLLLYDQKLDVPAVLGISLIMSGVIVLQLFSRSVSQ